MIIIILILARAFESPLFIGYLVFGVVWIAVSTIIRLNLKKPKNVAYTLVRVFVGLGYLIGLFILIIVINVMAGPIRFM